VTHLIVASRISLRLQAQSKAIDPSETHFVEMLSCARRRIMAISARVLLQSWGSRKTGVE